MSPRKPRPISPGDLVVVEGHRGVWKTLCTAAFRRWDCECVGEGLHLTSLVSATRVDLRDIPGARVSIAEGIFG